MLHILSWMVLPLCVLWPLCFCPGIMESSQSREFVVPIVATACARFAFASIFDHFMGLCAAAAPMTVASWYRGILEVTPQRQLRLTVTSFQRVWTLCWRLSGRSGIASPSVVFPLRLVFPSRRGCVFPSLSLPHRAEFPMRAGSPHADLFAKRTRFDGALTASSVTVGTRISHSVPRRIAPSSRTWK